MDHSMGRIFSKKQKKKGQRMDGKETETVVTTVNGGVTLREYKDGIRFGTDALLLSGFALPKLRKGLCADFGTGSGVLPLLLLSAGCKSDFLAVELQKSYALLAERNMEENGFSDRVRVCWGDLREKNAFLPAGSVSAVICNPPYLRAGAGKQNLAEEKRLAWHDDCLTADQLAEAACRALCEGGKLFCLYLPERMATLIAALKAHRLEPKRLRLVAPSAEEKPCLLLLEAMKDASEGLIAEPMFCIYRDRSHREESEQMTEIYRLFGDRRGT